MVVRAEAQSFEYLFLSELSKTTSTEEVGISF